MMELDRKPCTREKSDTARYHLVCLRRHSMDRSFTTLLSRKWSIILNLKCVYLQLIPHLISSMETRWHNPTPQNMDIILWETDRDIVFNPFKVPGSAGDSGQKKKIGKKYAEESLCFFNKTVYNIATD